MVTGVCMYECPASLRKNQKGTGSPTSGEGLSTETLKLLGQLRRQASG